jgi:hypothetical protein
MPQTGPAWTDTGHVFTLPDGHPWHPADVTDAFTAAATAAGLPRSASTTCVTAPPPTPWPPASTSSTPPQPPSPTSFAARGDTIPPTLAGPGPPDRDERRHLATGPGRFGGECEAGGGHRPGDDGFSWATTRFPVHIPPFSPILTAIVMA